MSIGLPVYNGECYGEAIEAVLSQTFGNFELVISDNASTDTTGKICREAANRDARVRYRNSMNLGAAPNFNRCFTLAYPTEYLEMDRVRRPDDRRLSRALR